MASDLSSQFLLASMMFLIQGLATLAMWGPDRHIAGPRYWGAAALLFALGAAATAARPLMPLLVAVWLTNGGILGGFAFVMAGVCAFNRRAVPWLVLAGIVGGFLVLATVFTALLPNLGLRIILFSLCGVAMLAMVARELLRIDEPAVRRGRTLALTALSMLAGLLVLRTAYTATGIVGPTLLNAPRPEAWTVPLALSLYLAVLLGLQWMAHLSTVAEVARGRAARREAAELDAIHSAVPMGIAVVDGEGRLAKANRRLVTIAGGIPSLDILRGPVDRVLASGQPVFDEELSVAMNGADAPRRTLLCSCAPLLGPAGAVTGAVAAVQDITMRKRAEIALANSEQRFQLAMQAVAGVVYDWDLGADRVTYSQGLDRLIGVPAKSAPSARAWWTSRVHPRDVKSTCERIDRDLKRRGDHLAKVREADYRVRHADGHYVDVWDRALVVREGGNPVRVVGSLIDIGERRRAEERLRLLMAELDHRVKNILATVMAVAQQSLHEGQTLQEYAETLTGRISALAHAHTLLSESRWSGAHIAALAARIFAPYGGEAGGRVTLSGPPVILTPRAAQALAITLNELLTNAAKYGALANDHGKVMLSWRRAGDGTLDMIWQERDGPELGEVAHSGFGTAMIRETLRHDLGGEAHLQFAAAGLECRISVPGHHIAKDDSIPPPSAVAPPVEGAATPPNARTGAPVRVLVVEDNGLIARAMVSLLDGMGYLPVGPAPSAKVARDLVESHGTDLAVLDMDLDGTSSLPLAENLAARGIAFAFVTGYGAGYALPDHLAETPCLPKPVEKDQLRRALAGLEQRLARRGQDTQGDGD